MHETKKPPYLTQCLRGKGDEIELAFEKSADILFRYFHWVMAVEACTADRQIADHVLEWKDYFPVSAMKTIPWLQKFSENASRIDGSSLSMHASF